MKNKFRPRRDFAGLAARRRRAGRLFAAGHSQAEVGRRLQVSRQSVSRWQAQWHAGGIAALRGAGRAGRKPRLTAAQLDTCEQALLQGAQAHGFRTALWTLPRVAQVIARVGGVRYHAGHVWRLLRALGWTRQRPVRRARERDETAIRRWIKTRWPLVKKTPAASTPG